MSSPIYGAEQLNVGDILKVIRSGKIGPPDL